VVRKGPDGLQIVRVRDRAAWRAWLERHHDASPGVWLVVAKKNARRPGITYVEAVEEALCFGWIDSRPNTLDEEHYLQRVSPRKPRSVWSRLNKERVARMIAEGRMTEAGLRPIEAAKRNGSWNALDDTDDLVVPDDLAAALASRPAARRRFDAYPPSVKKPALYWITSARRPETRAKRIAEVVNQAAEGKRPLQWQPRA
jgi:uncharacterized protein YdeI (YjbR/CyaY-like superfamily)